MMIVKKERLTIEDRILIEELVKLNYKLKEIAKLNFKNTEKIKNL